MASLIEQYLAIFEGSPFMYTSAAVGLLIVLSAILNLIVKKILLRLVNRALRLTPAANIGDNLIEKVIARLANVVPALIFTRGVFWIPHLPEGLASFIRNVAAAFIILTFAMAIAAALNVVLAIYDQRPDSANRPIKGYIQLLKLGFYLIAVILMIATLIDKSPILLLSGLGAMAAVLMLVFQDTLLSLVASIQISANGMVRVGDWIEMPNQNADGDVIDIALHTVTIQNFDRTITTLPTRKLITDSFKNWRGMQESGGRRIKRSIYIDQSSIHFMTDEEMQRVHRMRLLKDYLADKEKELDKWNRHLDDADNDYANHRRMTNIGTFRIYVERYLKNHENIVHNATLLVRQRDPGASGLPIEIYCFTNTTVWNDYEAIQSGIFDHLYSILPRFGLYPYQQPSGRDFQKIRVLETVSETVLKNDAIVLGKVPDAQENVG